MKSKEKEYYIIEEKIIQQSEYWHTYMYVYVQNIYMHIYVCKVTVPFSFPIVKIYVWSIAFSEFSP